MAKYQAAAFFLLTALAQLASACDDKRTDCETLRSNGYCDPDNRGYFPDEIGRDREIRVYWCPKTCYYCNGPPPPPASFPSPPRSPPPPPISSWQTELLALVNQGRKDNGLPPLCMNAKLNNAAHLHSVDMAENGYFSHKDLDGNYPIVRMNAAGYTNPLSGGENVAYGFYSPLSVYTAWKNSPGHWRNILKPVVVHIGLGYYKAFWTQVFNNSTTESCV